MKFYLKFLKTILCGELYQTLLCLSHARNKIAELKCLKSVYAPEFTFYLIGEYGVDNNFLVHRICITCDEISNSQHNKRIHESF
jgi:hypothetical protein